MDYYDQYLKRNEAWRRAHDNPLVAQRTEASEEWTAAGVRYPKAGWFGIGCVGTGRGAESSRFVTSGDPAAALIAHAR